MLRHYWSFIVMFLVVSVFKNKSFAQSIFVKSEIVLFRISYINQTDKSKKVASKKFFENFTELKNSKAEKFVKVYFMHFRFERLELFMRKMHYKLDESLVLKSI